ncbi:hypothetical protein ACFV0O_30345 [Kitasatospora sp. NPDC059577]|uniref:hypothetical protein n=1 Tax=Kitasatospora sp. NPDC059577 TaxID=3346873 RepID=UPI00367CD828
MVFRRWWFVRLLTVPQEQTDRRGPRRTRAERQRAERERRELVLGEWEVLRDRLARLAAQRVTAAGELFRAAELRLSAEETTGSTQSAARAGYLWALETFEAAGRLLEQAEDPHTDLPGLAAAVVLAEQAVERLAAAHALLAGHRPEQPTVRCFYNPLHGPALPAATAPRPGKKQRQRPTHGAREAAADRRPACRSCRNAILAGQTPDVLPALLPAGATDRGSGPHLVPYYTVPQQWSVWSATACGAYDPDAPALVLRGDHHRHPPR